MKNLATIILCIFLFSGCAIFIKPKSMAPVFPQPVFKGSPAYDSTLSFDRTGFMLKVNNKSSKSLHIVWNNSAIVENGVSHSLMPTGTKYINASESKPDLIIPAKTEVISTFSSANNVYYSDVYHMWIKNYMAAGEYVLSIAVLSGQEQESLDFKFSVKEELVDDSEVYEDIE